MAVDDVSVLRIVGRYQAQNIVNTLHYKHTVQASDENSVLANIGFGFQQIIMDDWLDMHNAAYSLIGLKMFRVTGDAKIPAFQLVGDPGTVVGDPMLSSAARVITLYTDSANHRRRGRVQLSGGSLADFEAGDGAVTAAQVALLQALGNLLILTLVEGGDEFQLCLPATEVLPVEEIVGTLGRSTPGVLRSRRVKRFYIG